MGIDKKYALLDTDFLYKSHLARNAKNHTLTDFVIEFAEYEFFCHEMIKKELSRHELNPDPNPWLEEKVKAGKVKLYTDREIVSELGKLYGKEATSIYLELLETSCDTFNANFYKQYYGSLNEMENLNDVEAFLAALKECDDNVPHKMGLGEKYKDKSQDEEISRQAAMGAELAKHISQLLVSNHEKELWVRELQSICEKLSKSISDNALVVKEKETSLLDRINEKASKNAVIVSYIIGLVGVIAAIVQFFI